VLCVAGFLGAAADLVLVTGFVADLDAVVTLFHRFTPSLVFAIFHKLPSLPLIVFPAGYKVALTLGDGLIVLGVDLVVFIIQRYLFFSTGL
jgi:hypothetical protein